jgi:hypothetical protein
MKYILLTVFFILLVSFSMQKETYKTYADSRHHFSFAYPAVWKIIRSKDTSFYAVCVPAIKKEKEQYDFCFDDIVFYIKVFNTALDSTLLSHGYRKIRNDYFTSDNFSDSVKTSKMSGLRWKGLYHHNDCKISCKDGSHHAGDCEFLYFSNDRQTILIESSAAGFEKNVFDKIKTTFRFNDN